jgi:hypothetical protein
MQGIPGHSPSLLSLALNNVADGSLLLALRVKMNEKIDATHFTCSVKYFIPTNVINLVYLFIKSASH